jgi:hypothetical protein
MFIMFCWLPQLSLPLPCPCCCRLFEAAEADLAAVKKVLEDSRLQGFVVRLRGMPYSATPADITSFLEGVQLAEVEDTIVIAHSVGVVDSDMHMHRSSPR